MQKRKPKAKPSQNELEQFVLRHSALKRLLEKLQGGSAVELRNLNEVVGKHAGREFKRRWNDELAQRKAQLDKPKVVTDYEAMLRTADLTFGRAEKLFATAGKRTAAGKKVNHAAIKELYGKAEKYYEEALEYLQSEHSKDRALEQWFDRQLVFDAAGSLSIDKDGVPRARTSRSHQNNAKTYDKNNKNLVAPTFATQSKAGIKLALVQEELDGMCAAFDELSRVLAASKVKAVEKRQSDASMLKSKQKQLSRRDF
jgi:hypothetical protein